MDIEQVRESIKRLRERRESIPALREYRPQGKRKSATATPAEPKIAMEDAFADLLNSEPEGKPAEGG